MPKRIIQGRAGRETLCKYDRIALSIPSGMLQSYAWLALLTPITAMATRMDGHGGESARRSTSARDPFFHDPSSGTAMRYTTFDATFPVEMAISVPVMLRAARDARNTIAAATSSGWFQGTGSGDCALRACR